MALPFEDDITISENPFLDLLMKNLKVLVYNCIIKDEYEANRKETPQSFLLSDLYMACIENTVSLGMFAESGITIPDQILEEVFVNDKNIIRLYKNFGNSIDWIPKDIDESKVSSTSRYSRTNYRQQLLIHLKSWFLQTYEEKNEYYRMICGMPSLSSWGIPIQDYYAYMPEYIKTRLKEEKYYHINFIHELDPEIINELNKLGILDIIRMEYPDEKYLVYLPAALDLYEVRKKADWHILWLPENVVNENIKKEFEAKYNERREYIIKTVYTSAMELESEFYHSTMIIFLLITTILDMISELQQHIIKKDILDRRCVEYLFAEKGVVYYKNIPYIYQEKLCHNLHELVKYKSCTKTMLTLRSLFGFDDEVEIYRYYLMKIRKYDIVGNFIIDGEQTLISEPNDVINHYSVVDNLNEYTVEESIKFPDQDDDILVINREIPYPYENYSNKECQEILVVTDKNILLTKDKDYILQKDEDLQYIKYIKIKKEIIDNINGIKYEFYVDELLNTNEDTTSNLQDIKINTIYVYNYANRHKISLAEVYPFAYNYLTVTDKLWVVINDYWLNKDIIEDNTKITKKSINNFYSYKINETDVEIFCNYNKDGIKDHYWVVYKDNANETINTISISIDKQSNSADLKYVFTNTNKSGMITLKDNKESYWLMPSNYKNFINNLEELNILCDVYILKDSNNLEVEIKQTDDDEEDKIIKEVNNNGFEGYWRIPNDYKESFNNLEELKIIQQNNSYKLKVFDTNSTEQQSIDIKQDDQGYYIEETDSITGIPSKIYLEYCFKTTDTDNQEKSWHVLNSIFASQISGNNIQIIHYDFLLKQSYKKTSDLKFIEIKYDNDNLNYYIENNNVKTIIEKISDYEILEKSIIKDDTGDYWLIPNSYIKSINDLKELKIQQNTDGNYQLQIFYTNSNGQQNIAIKQNNGSYYIEEGTETIVFEKNDYSQLSKFLNPLDNIFTVLGNYWFIKNINKEEIFTIKNNESDNYQITRIINKDDIINREIKTTKEIDPFSLFLSYNIKRYSKEFDIIFDHEKQEYILEIDDFFDLDNKDIYIVYFDSDATDIRFYKKEIDISAREIESKKIEISEKDLPFPNYFENNNNAYITITEISISGNTEKANKQSIFLIPEVDYKIVNEINEGTEEVHNFITFTSSIKEILQDILNNLDNYKIGIHYIYTADSKINKFKMTRSINDINDNMINIPIKYKRQLEFSVKSEFEKKNVENIYSMYMRYNGKWYRPNIDFFYTNSNVIIDDNIVIDYSNNYIELLPVCFDKNKEEFEYNNISIFKETFIVNINGQNIFELNFPVDNYYADGINQILMDVNGEPKNINDYYYEQIDGKKDTSKIAINTSEASINSIINITYIYNKTGTYQITPNLIQIPFTKNQNNTYNYNNIENDSDNRIPKLKIININETNELNNISLNNIILDSSETETEKHVKVENASSFEIIVQHKLIDNKTISFTDIGDRQKFEIDNLNFIFMREENDKREVTTNILYFNIINKSNSNLINDNTIDLIHDISLEDLDTTTGVNLIDKLSNKNFPLDYIDNQWPYYITYEDYEQNTKLLSEKNYDIINGLFYLNTVKNEGDWTEEEDNNYEIQNINKVTIHFVYKLKPGYIYSKYLEEYDKNVQLEFCKVPLSDEFHLSEYISDRNNWKDYNSVISNDSWWTGNEYNNKYFQSLKKQIYDSKFNIIRTKYYGLSQKENLSVSSIKASMFYSMLYDDTFIFYFNQMTKDDKKILKPDKSHGIEEDKLVVDVKSISSYTDFPISHLFLYIICLSYLYNNQDLPLISHPDFENPTTVMGFNFKADLDNIKKILKDKYLQNNSVINSIDNYSLDVNITDLTEHERHLMELLSEVILGQNIESQTVITGNEFKRFMEIYKTNTDVYEKIIQYMLETEDIKEFRVWDYLYYELMTWKYSTNYFLLDQNINGISKLADTYEEFLKNKNEILYNNLQSIKNIFDIDTKIDTITQYLEDIEYSLNDTLFKDEYASYNYLIKNYITNFSNIMITYMKQMIDFFKSYKVYIKNIDTVVSFDDGKENEENTYKIYEEIIFKYTNYLFDYMDFSENIQIKTKRNNESKEIVNIENIRS